MRLATYDTTGVDLGDHEAVEKSWNDFVDVLRWQGLRPAEDPLRWTDASATYRVFVIEHDDIPHSLDFDITKLGVEGVIA